MARGDKYIELNKYLKVVNKENIELRFEEIEKIVNFKLPASAYNSLYSWWGNDETHSQALAWLNAGYIVKVDFERQVALFMIKNRLK